MLWRLFNGQGDTRTAVETLSNLMHQVLAKTTGTDYTEGSRLLSHPMRSKYDMEVMHQRIEEDEGLEDKLVNTHLFFNLF